MSIVRTLGKNLGWSKDRLLGRSLDKLSIRRRLSWLDWIEFVCVGSVAFGLYFESNKLWEANTLVTLGVFGEFIVHRLHAIASKREEKLADVEIERLRTEADAARADAARAIARAAEASQQAEEERLKRVEIEDRRADRRLTKEQFESIVTRLKPFAPIDVGILVSAHSTEALNFGVGIGVALRGAGWHNALATRLDPTVRHELWIELVKDADALSQRAARELMTTLRAVGILTSEQITLPQGGSFGGNEPDKQKATGAPILINVGLHPRGY